MNWKEYNEQVFGDGPKSMAYDPFHHVIYSSNWRAGVWKLQLNVPRNPCCTVLWTHR